MKRIIAIAKKEIVQIIRDPLSLAIAFLMPVILIFIFGYAITLDINNVTTIVYDKDKSSLSRSFVSSFAKSGYFTIVGFTENHKTVDKFLDSNKARMALLIPEKFSKNLNKGFSAPVQIIVDGGDSNTANIVIGYIGGVVELFTRSISKEGIKPKIDVRTRVWFNPELESKNFIVPGLIAIVMMVISALLTSLTVSREWERGTMEQLISTPVKTHELIIGKIVPYFLIGFIDVCLALFMGIVVFKVALQGSLFLVMLLSSIFLFGGLSLGILISIVARSQLLANQIALLATFLPAFLLSGFMFAIANMPKSIQLITYVVPARYFMTIIRDIFLKGSTLHLLINETMLLLIYGVVVFVIANKKFKRVVD